MTAIANITDAPHATYNATLGVWVRKPRPATREQLRQDRWDQFCERANDAVS